MGAKITKRPTRINKTIRNLNVDSSGTIREATWFMEVLGLRKTSNNVSEMDLRLSNLHSNAEPG